jgi:hypothetical protein
MTIRAPEKDRRRSFSSVMPCPLPQLRMGLPLTLPGVVLGVGDTRDEVGVLSLWSMPAPLLNQGADDFMILIH